MRVAFISEGKLFLKSEGAPAIEIESPFAREAVERASHRHRRNAWKTTDADANSNYNSQVIWGRQAGQPSDGAPIFRHIARGARSGEILYTLVMSASSGLFQLNLETREEIRLFHRQDFDPCGLAAHPTTGEVVVSSLDKDDLGKLEVLEGEGRHRRQITSGDGFDSNPAFDPRRPRAIVFECTGVARNEAGQIVAHGPTGLSELDQDAGEVKSLLEDERSDYLSPKFSPGGQLHFVHRPTLAGRSLPLGARLKAFVLLPYHLAVATFGFLDAFSRIFGKRSLKPRPAGHHRPEAASRYATFLGLTVDLERALSSKIAGSAVQLVPRDWELLRYHPDGSVETLARHVVAFDIGSDGTIVYSDGLRLWKHGEHATPFHEGHVVQAVAIV